MTMCKKQCRLIYKTDRKIELAWHRLQPKLEFTRMLMISAGDLNNYFFVRFPWKQTAKKGLRGYKIIT